jgi:hypothetical protein
MTGAAAPCGEDRTDKETMAGKTNMAVERFIERWQSASGSERANYQLPHALSDHR